MPEDTKGEMPATVPADEISAGATLSIEQLQAQLKEQAAHIGTLNKENAKRRKALESFEADKQAKADAELSEMEKLRKQLDQYEATNKALTVNALKRQIAAEVGLPDALAMRLQGDDADALKADAESLLATLPKAAPSAPAIPVTNPGQGAQKVKPTDKQRMARIMGHRVDAFDPAVALQHGGGVVHSE